MNRLIDKIRTIPNLYIGTPVSEEAIASAEHDLSLRFSEDYSDYLKTFGAIDFYATEWTGLNTDDFRDVVKTTLEARETYSDFPKDKFILEDLHVDDILVLADSQNCVYMWQNGFIEKTQDSLLGYLEDCLKRQEF